MPEITTGACRRLYPESCDPCLCEIACARYGGLVSGVKASARWDRHFIDMALLCASMSKDPRTQVGAVIVGPDLEVRSTGFNGFPRDVADTQKRLHDKETKLRLVVHAEVNAILNAARVGIPLKGCTLYLAATDDTGAVWGGPPCTRCSLDVIQAGITRVVSLPFKAGESTWAADVAAAGELLREAGVIYREVTFTRSIPT
jgi:dCMP deaminase